MALKQVELIRARILRGYQVEISKLRVHLSMFESGTDLVDRLKSPDTEKLLATITDATLRHLGHDPEKFNRNGGQAQSADNPGSAVRRAVAKNHGAW